MDERNRKSSRTNTVGGAASKNADENDVEYGDLDGLASVKKLVELRKRIREKTNDESFDENFSTISYLKRAYAYSLFKYSKIVCSQTSSQFDPRCMELGTFRVSSTTLFFYTSLFRTLI